MSECLLGVRSVASITLEHGINANLVHKWIRLSREQPTTRMVPVSPPGVEELVAEGGHIELSLSALLFAFMVMWGKAEFALCSGRYNDWAAGQGADLSGVRRY